MVPILPALLEGDPFDTDAETLASAALGAVPRPQRTPLAAAVEMLGSPAAHLLTSPLSARIAGWGVREGLRAVHHELRCAPPLGEEQLPELDVWEDARAEPRWRDGTLLVPKYFSAFLDAPLPTYDPNHRSKWRPHELLHRLVGFFWRRDMTRFEFYLGGRLGELLPVVHWYGLDEIGRVRCAEHRGIRPDRGLCRRCEAVVRPYWDDDVDVTAAVVHAAHALEHLTSELEACEAELQTGRVHASPRPGLDASSDAVGYLRGPWNRVTSWSFGAWVERFAQPGIDVFDTNEAFLRRVRECFVDLVARDITVDTERGQSEASRRDLSDLGYRALCLVELADDDRIEEAIVPLVDRAAELGRQPSIEAGEVRSWRAELEAELARVIGAEDASAVVATGSPELGLAEASVRQIVTGLRSALPRSTAELQNPQLSVWARAFAEHPIFGEAEPIGRRFASFMRSHPDVPSSLRAALELESWLLMPPRIDEEAERFGVIPEVGARGRLRGNSTLRRGTFDAAAVMTVLDDFEVEGRVELVAVHYGGEPRVIECDADVRSALEAADSGRWLQNDETTQALLDGGFLAFFPTVR